MMNKKAFTLVELLVVIGVLSIAGVLILTIFSNTLKGNNKSQILISIKQNGQSVLETMTNVIRNADRVVCPDISSTTMVVVKDGFYTRYRYVATTNTTNGYIQQESFKQPSSPPAGSDPNLYIRDFEKTLCIDPPVDPQVLTDTHPQSGVSLTAVSFTRDRSAGFKDGVKINFSLSPAVQAPSSLAGQIDSVTFETTIQLR